MEDYQLINVTVYDPTNSLFKSGNDRAECRKFSCKSKECSARDEGTCLMVANLFRSSCPHGKVSTETGFTKRARKFHEWIMERKERYADKLYLLKSAPHKIFKVDGGYMLPYSYMNMCEKVNFRSHGHIFSSGCSFIADEDMTPEALVTLVHFKPQAMMGGEIKDYQKEVVPKLVKDLQDFYPELYSGMVKHDPSISDMVENYSYVGRKALLSSLKPCDVQFGKREKDKYVWDGEYLTGKHDILFSPVKAKETTVKILPEEGESVTIHDNSQVDSETIFID